MQKLTPLHYASYGGYLKIVQLLQENGAHIDPLDEVYTCMCTACTYMEMPCFIYRMSGYVKFV